MLKSEFDADDIFRDLEDEKPELEDNEEEKQELNFGQNKIYDPEDLFMGDDEY